MTAPLSFSDRLAQRLALAVPALLLAGAYISEYFFGLAPCEMCWWQRYPHFAAIALVLLSTLAPPRRAWIALAGLAVFVSGLIGVFHAGVEWHWWQGITDCSGFVDPFALGAVRCDEAAFRFLGLSLAGWNALISIGGALAMWLLLLAREKRA